MRTQILLLFLIPNTATLQTPFWSQQLEVTASALKLREAPTLDAGVVAVLPQGAVVENQSRNHDEQPVWDVIDGKGAFWTRVSYQGQSGYLFGAYLKADFYIFYENTIVEDLPKVKNWYAVYKTPKGDELRKTEVFTTLDSVEITGGLAPILRVRSAGESKFIVGADRELKTGIVGDYYLRQNQWGDGNDFRYELAPGKNLMLNSLHASLHAPGSAIELLATGSFDLGSGWLEQRDFKIWITQKNEPDNIFTIKQDLTPFFNPNDASCTIKWWGDLDGDGKPDVLIGRCASGEGGCTDYLFLSTKAKAGELLRPAAAFYWGMGC